MVQSALPPVPEGAIDFYFVRHGESVANREGRWQGQTDSRLSPLGEQQAATLAERFATRFGPAFDRMVASDLSRARATGEAVARRLGFDLQLDPTWREIDVGDWEGLTRGQVAARFPEQIAAIQDRRDVKIGGGESWAELAERVSAALEQLRQKMQGGQRAAVFAHGGVIASLVVKVLQVSPARPRRLGNVDNTALTVLRWENDRFVLGRFNDATHLRSLGDWGTEKKHEGATIVTLLPPGQRAEPPDDFAGVYALDEGERVRGKIDELGGRYRGRRVALQGSTDALEDYVDEVLGETRSPGLGSGPADMLRPANRRVLPPRGLTHVVSLEGAQTLANFNVGD